MPRGKFSRRLKWKTFDLPCVKLSVTVTDADKFDRGINILRWLESKNMPFLTMQYDEHSFTLNCDNDNDINRIIKLFKMNPQMLDENGCVLTSTTTTKGVVKFTEEDAYKMMLSMMTKPENTGTRSVFIPK